MVVPIEPRILSADRLDGALLIAFDDGGCALYSAALLVAMRPQADQVSDTDLEE